MKVLLDTQLLLWAAGKERKLSRAARALIGDPNTVPMFSAASLWEIAIKRSLDRSDFQVDPALFRRALFENGYLEIPVTGEHAATVSLLPLIHKDPFDRLLVAQSIVEALPLLTADPVLAQYGGLVRKL